MAITRVEFDERTFQVLEQAAARRGISVPQLLLVLAGEVAEDPEATQDARESLLAFVGRGRSELGDLAERHDDYLATSGER